MSLIPITEQINNIILAILIFKQFCAVLNQKIIQRTKNSLITSWMNLKNNTKSLEHIYNCISKENPAATIITGDFNARSP